MIVPELCQSDKIKKSYYAQLKTPVGTLILNKKALTHSKSNKLRLLEAVGGGFEPPRGS